jgi:hypothetical protein
VVALTLTAVALPASASTAARTSRAVRASTAGRAAAGGSGCKVVYQPPRGWVEECSSGSSGGGVPGSGGGGGGGGKSACTVQLLSKGQIGFLGLPSPPKGKKWAAITCVGKQPFGGVTLVSDNGAGTVAVNPWALLQILESELHVPVLTAETAPPRHKDGLVGLPEWYWIRRGFKAVGPPPIHLGGASASLTATPSATLTFDPGGGLPSSSCGNGPGIPYTTGASPAGACTYTYQQSSATQPGGAYAAAVVVRWKVTWVIYSPQTGTRTGGRILAVPDQFSLKVAEGQALVTGNGAGR